MTRGDGGRERSKKKPPSTSRLVSALWFFVLLCVLWFVHAYGSWFGLGIAALAIALIWIPLRSYLLGAPLGRILSFDCEETSLRDMEAAIDQHGRDLDARIGAEWRAIGGIDTSIYRRKKTVHRSRTIILDWATEDQWLQIESLKEGPTHVSFLTRLPGGLTVQDVVAPVESFAIDQEWFWSKCRTVFIFHSPGTPVDDRFRTHRREATRICQAMGMTPGVGERPDAARHLRLSIAESRAFLTHHFIDSTPAEVQQVIASSNELAALDPVDRLRRLRALEDDDPDVVPFQLP